MTYDASGIRPIISADESVWTPVCHICQWQGQPCPADSAEYYNLTITHVHSALPESAEAGDVDRDSFVCPRCGRGIPNDRDRGAYRGALSRVDGVSEICSACGAHEALLGYHRGSGITEIWPVQVPEEFYR